MDIGYSYRGWEVELVMEESIGCCGVCVFHSLKLKEVGDGRSKATFAKGLGENMLNAAMDLGYGIATLSTVGKVVDDELSYWSSMESNHDEKFNLGDVAEAIGMDMIATTINPQTQNEIFLYNKVIK